MPAPIAFVTSNADGVFEVQQEALDLLNTIQGPIAVVAVAGMWRTGKSFLLNSLLGLNGQPESFVVGNSVNACTKGLWIWGAPVQLEDGLTVLFVDSEGLGSTARTATEDVQIFSLAILLSSFFIWNSRGTIDGNALDDFGLIVNISKRISVSSSGDGDLAGHFPAFLWVVRDFTLRLERNGRKMDDREYLEEALKPQRDESSRDEIRKLVGNFFAQRDCVTLVRPAEDESALRNLSAQPLSSLRPEFVGAMERLKAKLFGTLRPKMVNGQKVTGRALGTLAATYAEAFNRGGVPSISSAWQRVVVGQADAAVASGVNAYLASLARHLKLDQLILEQLSGNEATTNTPLGPSLASGAFPMEAEALAEAHENALAAAWTELGGYNVEEWGAVLQAETRGRIAAAATARRIQVANLNFNWSIQANALAVDAMPSPDGKLEMLCTQLIGSGKDAMQAQVTATRVPVGALAEAEGVNVAGKRNASRLRGDLRHGLDPLDQVRARLKAEAEAAAAESKDMARTTENAQRSAAHEAALEAERVRGKQAELARCQLDLSRLEAAYETCLAELASILESDEALGQELHQTYLTLQTQAAVHDLPSGAEKQPALEQGAKSDGKALKAQIPFVREECQLLMAHADLIQQNITATKELMAVKEAEVQEREFAWGMAKAKVAHEEGEAYTLEEEIDLLGSLASKLKGHLSSRLTQSLPADLTKELDSTQVALLKDLAAVE